MTVVDTRFRVALIGLGGQGAEVFLPLLQSTEQVKLAAICDIDETRLLATKATCPQAHAFRKWQELLKTCKIDGVFVCLPHHLHLEVCSTFASRGVHIFKEKPLAMTLREGQILVALARKHGVCVSVGTQRRFSRAYAEAQRLLPRLGRIFVVDGRYTIYTSAPYQGWRGRKDWAGGGCVIDMGYHLVDSLMRFIGLPDEIFCHLSCTGSREKAYDAEDTARIIFRNGQEAVWGSLLVSRVMPPKQEMISLFGDCGSLSVGKNHLILRDAAGKTLVQKEFDDHRTLSRLQVEDFLSSARTGATSCSAAHTHVDSIRFIEAAYASASARCFVRPRGLAGNTSRVFDTQGKCG